MSYVQGCQHWNMVAGCNFLIQVEYHYHVQITSIPVPSNEVVDGGHNVSSGVVKGGRHWVVRYKLQLMVLAEFNNHVYHAC